MNFCLFGEGFFLSQNDIGCIYLIFNGHYYYYPKLKSSHWKCGFHCLPWKL